MSAGYVAPKTTVDPRTRRAQVELAVRNQSRETWRASEGFAIGYQIFDAETGTLVVDGARMPPEHDVRPGDSTPVRLDFELPVEDGRYQVFISPLREGVCWRHERTGRSC